MIYFFVGKNNGIDDKICSENNYMCKNCMILNKEYHKIATHHLINKCGRETTYLNGQVYCACHYIDKFEVKIVIDDQDKGQKEKSLPYEQEEQCGRYYKQCKACKELQDKMKFYLDEGILKKLYDRDERYQIRLDN